MAENFKLLFYDFFTGKLTFDTSLHIGSSEVSVDTDAPLLRDAGGRFYLPGTSIIGPLRARAIELFEHEKKLMEKIFGFQKQNGNEGAMSRLLVEDAYPSDNFLQTTVRDGVAIDRRLDSAYPGAKYDLEITPKGISFDLTMRLELREKDEIDKMRFIVRTIFNELKDGKIRFGGCKTRGLGRCHFGYTNHVLDFGKREDLIDYLVSKDISKLPGLNPLENPGVQMEAIDDVDIKVALSIEESPFLIKNGREDSEHDAVFTRVFKINGDESDYIPGSSLKGVFRSRAEKILRTLGAKPCMTVGGESCTAKIKNLIDLEKSDKNDATRIDENNAPRIKKESCPICRLFGNGYLGGRISFDDAFFEELPGKKQFDGVAIDRFTGGAMEGKLFDACPAVSGKTEINIHVKGPLSNLEKALVSFLLRDLDEGFPPLRFGYGKSKGYGLLKCNAINGKAPGKEGISGIFQSLPDLKEWWKEQSHE